MPKATPTHTKHPRQSLGTAVVASSVEELIAYLARLDAGKAVRT